MVFFCSVRKVCKIDLLCIFTSSQYNTSIILARLTTEQTTEAVETTEETTEVTTATPTVVTTEAVTTEATTEMTTESLEETTASEATTTPKIAKPKLTTGELV